MNYLARLAALFSLVGTINSRAGEGYRDTRPKEPPDEVKRALLRQRFAERGKRRYRRWLLSQGKFVE